jgi:hypothetical protein
MKPLKIKTMKKIAFLITATFLSMIVTAQENSYDFLLNKENNPRSLWNFYGGFTFQHLYVKTNTMPGLELGVVLNRNFMMGAFGQGTVGNFSHLHNTENYSVMLGEGGIMAGYVTEPFKTLHFGGTFKVGYVSLVADDEEIKLFSDFEPVAEDAGVVYHPEIFSELNVSRFMKIRLGAGYSFYLLNDESILCNTELDSWTLNMSLVFSNFSK